MDNGGVPVKFFENLSPDWFDPEALNELVDLKEAYPTAELRVQSSQEVRASNAHNQVAVKKLLEKQSIKDFLATLWSKFLPSILKENAWYEKVVLDREDGYTGLFSTNDLAYVIVMAWNSWKCWKSWKLFPGKDKQFKDILRLTDDEPPEDQVLKGLEHCVVKHKYNPANSLHKTDFCLKVEAVQTNLEYYLNEVDKEYPSYMWNKVRLQYLEDMRKKAEEDERLKAEAEAGLAEDGSDGVDSDEEEDDDGDEEDDDDDDGDNNDGDNDEDEN